MKIGDKVIINKILPLTATGHIKPIKRKYKEFIEYSFGEGQTIATLASPFYDVKDRIVKENGNVVFKFHKVDIGKKEGILVGFRKKKLSREYNDQVGKPPPGGWINTISRRSRNTRSPNRLDDFRKLDTVAIVALSNYKMVVVDTKDLIFNDIKII